MLEKILGSRSAPVDVNSRQSLIAIIYLAVIGPCVFIVQPGFVQGLVEYLGFAEQQAGYVAAAEMWGIATSTLLLVFAASRFSWRTIILWSITLCALGNFLSIGQAELKPLIALRFITGLGSGGLISLTFTMAGLTQRPDRNFASIIVWVLLYGAVILFAMPWAYQTVGINGVFIFFGLFCLSGLLFIRNLPDSGASHIDTTRSYEYRPTLKHLTLAAILVFNIAIGIVWAYLFLVGLETNMSEQAVAGVLTVSQLFGIAGAMFVVFYEIRFGRLGPMLVCLVGIGASIYLLVGGVSQRDFWIGVCGFNLLWNVAMPYWLSTAGDFDAKGQTVVYAVAVQMLGLAIGPYVAAQLLEAGGFDLVNMVAVALFLVSLIMVLPGILAQRPSLQTRRS